MWEDIRTAQAPFPWLRSLKISAGAPGRRKRLPWLRSLKISAGGPGRRKRLSVVALIADIGRGTRTAQAPPPNPTQPPSLRGGRFGQRGFGWARWATQASPPNPTPPPPLRG